MATHIKNSDASRGLRARDQTFPHGREIRATLRRGSSASPDELRGKCRQSDSGVAGRRDQLPDGCSGQQSLAADLTEREAIMNFSHETGDCGGRCLLELIRARAYQIFESRGRSDGHALEDWLEAEREVKDHLGLESPWKQYLK